MEAKQLRAQARERLTGNWPLAIGVAAVAFLLGSIGTSFLPNFDFSWTQELPFLEDITLFEDVEGFKITFQNGIISILPLILGGVLELGYSKFLLKLHDQKSPEFNDLFSEFDRFGTAFAQNFLRGLYTFLWSLLFIIPGIVKSYSYAMTPYILSDHPDMSASDAITLSTELMDGHKGELFILDLSFIGWDILASLAVSLGYLALNPYRAAARTAFYRQLTANPR